MRKALALVPFLTPRTKGKAGQGPSKGSGFVLVREHADGEQVLMEMHWHKPGCVHVDGVKPGSLSFTRTAKVLKDERRPLRHLPSVLEV